MNTVLSSGVDSPSAARDWVEGSPRDGGLASGRSRITGSRWPFRVPSPAPPVTAPPVTPQPEPPRDGPNVPASSMAEAAWPDTRPDVWRAHQVGRSQAVVQSTGFAGLDAQLPGRGWPFQVLTELVLPQWGVGEIRLLAPSLAAVQHAGRVVMLFDPPADLSALALTQLGLDVSQLLMIQTQTPAGQGRHPRGSRALDGASLWALEQALKSGQVGAVLAWLPRDVRYESLRRLQLAAQAHEGPAFVVRHGMGVRPQDLGATPAPLRLSLQAAGADRLAVQVLKRRGPPLLECLHLVLPPVLPVAVQARAVSHANPVCRVSVRGDGVPVLKTAVFINLADAVEGGIERGHPEAGGVDVAA